MSLNDKAHNTIATAGGKAKEVVGRATKDEGLQFEGKVEQLVAQLKQAGEKLKDALKSGPTTKSTKESRASR